ncbi:hypothetical protein SAMN05421866_4197 [Chryseobacterium oranimense]|uniref:Uncharacterized protein n=1 Tax=Chryseobacterium oranimense TaxID=421058 RepID=A0A1M5WSN1_9FLAO|nr:hypothetical protein [Chryseobacterium oranimense]SHH90033.1 hypothetical protein SAMN05421866_4197 [Chryseobacterium oranimense]
MNTKYVKVSTADRLPEESKHYITLNSQGQPQVSFYDNLEFVSYFKPVYWLEEKPDYDDEVIRVLQKCYDELLLAAEKGNYPDSFLEENGGSGLSEISNLITKIKES